MIRLSLPYPPSANALWRSVGGRNISSREYREWQKAAAQEALVQRPTKVAGPYSIALSVDRPDNRRRDLANLEKATSDALVSAGVIADDCLARKIELEWSDRPAGKGARVHICIIPMEAAR